MNNQLQRQIQDEINQEAMIERKIKNGLKRVLKSFKQYKLVDTVDEGLLLLLFDKKTAHEFSVILLDDELKKIVKNNLDPNLVVYFLRPKNKHNSRLQVISNLDKGKLVVRN